MTTRFPAPTARSLAAVWQAGERAHHQDEPSRIGTVVDANIAGAGVVRVQFPGAVALESYMFFELESPDVTYGD